MNIYLMVLCWVAVDVAVAEAYTAAAWRGEGAGGAGEALSAARAARARGEKVDIMVLPSDDIDPEDYDEVVRGLSAAARRAGLYLVAPLTLQEGPPRGGRPPGGRTTLVFDRQGAILVVSRKPTCKVANNTAPPESLLSAASFRTDFGVTFALLAEEQLVLGAPPGDVRDVVLAGTCHSEIPYFNAAQFTASWAYTHRANVLTARGLVAGRGGPRVPEPRGPLALVHLDDTGHESGVTPPVSSPASLPPLRAELARYIVGYIVRPVDLLAGAEGYSDTVCHNAFCCEFYLKIRATAPQSDMLSYGLAAFDGARRFLGSKHVGAQNCAVFACTGLYKRSCSFGSVNNSTNITFEKLTISANFSYENTVPYPLIFSDHNIAPEHFQYVVKSVGQVRSVKVTVTDADSLLAFGAFGRVFERDYDSVSESEDLYNYIFNDDVHEFFDYLWIRVRILMVIVSIYVLEMM